jgi:hypothetical protein
MRWPRALQTWLLMMLAETAHGILRRAVLIPWLGPAWARQLAVPVGSLLVLTIAWVAVPRLGAQRLGQQLRLGAAWVGLTLVFELGLGAALGLSRERLLADYIPAQGGWMGLGLLVMLLAPALVARCRRPP